MFGKGNACLTPLLLKMDVPATRSPYLYVRCGHCINCKKYRTSQMMIRLDCESKYYPENQIAFVTLTYNDDCIHRDFLVDGDILSDREKKLYSQLNPFDKDSLYQVTTLNTKDVQLYLKRIRKYIFDKYKHVYNFYPNSTCSLFSCYKRSKPLGRKLYRDLEVLPASYRIRYYAVGEYGGRTERPHLHILFFGLHPEDYKMLGYTLTETTRMKLGQPVQPRYVAWSYGHVQVDSFHSGTCQYIAGYVQKKLYGDDSIPYRVSEFLRCSQHLGERWLLDHLYMFSDEHPYMDINGFKYGLPRRFREILIEKGILSPTNLYEVIDVQSREIRAVLQDVDNKHTTWSDFERQRFINSIQSHQSRLNGRNSRF